MVDLKGNVAVVTAVGQGIGRGIALSLERTGADIIVTDISDSVFEIGKQIKSQNFETSHSHMLPSSSNRNREFA